LLAANVHSTVRFIIQISFFAVLENINAENTQSQHTIQLCNENENVVFLSSYVSGTWKGYEQSIGQSLNLDVLHQQMLSYAFLHRWRNKMPFSQYLMWRQSWNTENPKLKFPEVYVNEVALYSYM
jgi:hypothetical protein